LAEVGKVIVGQTYMVERLLIGLLTGGHVLLEGVPGLAKTLTVRPLPTPSPLKFQRIQFTPDLLPADLIGTVIYNQQTGRVHEPRRARSSPTSSSPTRSTAPRPRCRARCSRPCRSGRSPSATRPTRCPIPFIVMATQNPIEQEGTYPLPEAQVDRFMLMVKVGYPTRDEERKIMDRMTGRAAQASGRTTAGGALARARKVVGTSTSTRRSRTTSWTSCSRRASRSATGSSDLAPLIEYGASPRASIA
jgi:MoxR-like ATPase